MGIVDDLKANFKQGNVLIRLIYINIGVFVLLNLVNLFFYLFAKSSLNDVFNALFAFPSNFLLFAIKPWTIITYMFVHADIWHILFNLLWLYWFGQIFLQYLTQKQLVGVYFLGGIAGALLYAVAYNFFPAFHLERFGSTLVGASAAIMAVVFAVSTLAPNFKINLLLFGAVKLKYIAIVTIVIDAISVQYSNAGGHLAHLGGALFGYIFAVNYSKGRDLTKGFSALIDWFTMLFKPRKRMKVTYKRPVDDYEYNRTKVEQQKEVDRILDKIAKGGYQSLSREEKDFLFKSSK